MTLRNAILGCELLKPIVSLFSALLFFFIGTPFALLDFDTFWSFDYPQGVLWQFFSIGQVGSWAAFFANGRKVLVEFFPSNLSLPFFIIVIGSFVEFLLLRKSAELTLLFLFPILYSLLVVRGTKFSQHYFLPIYPFLVLLVGRFVEKISRVSLEWFKNIWPFLLALIFLPALISSFRVDLIFARADTRTIASHWVDEEISPGRVGAIIGTKDIEIVKDGVNDEFVRDLSTVDDFSKYDFLIVTETDLAYAKEKLIPKGFELVEEISSLGRRGPDVYIFTRVD